jgi:hypothetical protein
LILLCKDPVVSIARLNSRFQSLRAEFKSSRSTQRRWHSTRTSGTS